MGEDLFTEDKITSICAQVEDIDAMEELRLKFRKRRINFVLTAVAVIVMAVVVLSFNTGALVGTLTIVLPVVGLIVFYAFYVGTISANLHKRFQENIIKRYLAALLSDSEYEPERRHDIDVYNHSLLYTTSVDRYNGNNYVTGKLDKTALSFSFLHTEYKTETHSSKSGTKTTWHTIFKGVFMQADSNKNFAGKTLVLPDTAEKYLGGFGKWLQKTTGGAVGKMVYLENVKFEKEFVVYSTDPVEARYLLTPKIQEQILAMKHFLKKDLRLSFVDNAIYIAISRENIFKLNVSLSFKKPETLRYYMRDLIELLTLIHLLDLNIRIWGRE
ncbi:MAG: DUF3137 domain-containing protein [Bacteroidales bacterium]|jgi:hypothetical protein|nr:DUF3137 domain-containing protein [Bacteroidales bacterium]